MTKTSFYNIILLLCLTFVIYYSLNVYFINHLQSTTPLDDGVVGHSNGKPGSNKVKPSKVAQSRDLPGNAHLVQSAIMRTAGVLKPAFRNRNPKYVQLKQELVACVEPKPYNISTIWKTANSWPKANEVVPGNEKLVGAVINAIATEPILRIKNSQRGTQLKLVFEFAQSQHVLFKPKWYNREEVINGTVYSGKDRHNSEIVSFHLAMILNLRSSPIVAGRRFSLRDHVSRTAPELQISMPIVNNRQCIYGVCYYCNSDEMVCDDPDSGLLEGAVLYTIPGKINKLRSPWQRTYDNSVLAAWEKNDNYCSLVRKKLTLEALLDLIDAALFDFLIQNGDRHHYETRDGRLLLLDNGKGFGNPYVDHMDILAPLYQCCIVRRTTWERLLLFSGGALTDTLRAMNELDLLKPLLTKEHYDALERRLLYIYGTVELCKEKYGTKLFK
ncbi:glycosaminoglycan xylosylkinase homolog [Anopheles ziemanni]|uniref:glycosaminoglycan xylosylkinase homolog n=2 Tax=coustani group TaxID=59130 RepID=UPI00265B46A4|nr:glycosaminoglycan xylosylkinase homolog isoform X1 [Anopheles coustani]XP_058175482.1 glycosaminoglycan xylosylkinase homolog [Anopheles ziemanni]